MDVPRFRSDEHPVRTRLGSAALVGGASMLLSMFGRRSVRHRPERLWGRMVPRFLRIQVDRVGVERVDPTEQYVIASLHEGLVDAAMLLGLPLDLRFTARDELFDWPHLGRYLRRAGHIVVPSGASLGGLRRLYREAAHTFECGESLVFFPQGSILGIETAFRPGAFRIAERFDRPVLPVVITGTHRVVEHPFSPVVRYGERVSMQILEPVPGRDAVRHAAELEREMKRIALGPTMAPVRRFVPERDGWWDAYDYRIDPAFGELAAAVAARHGTDVRRVVAGEFGD